MTLRARETIRRLAVQLRRNPGRRRLALSALVIAVGLLGLGGAYAAGSASHSESVASSLRAVEGGGVDTHAFPSGPGEPGIFTDRCAYSHEAPDDAILAFGRPGTSMHHDFYGNTATTASSTASSLVGGQTTCTTSADSSAYWSPVLYQNGHELKPGPALIYWRRPARDSERVSALPIGLQLIAGNEGATAPQGTDVVAWSCTGKQPGRGTPTPHNCASGTDVRVTVTFPSCWDGHNLIGARQLNVVYRTAAGCPADHPQQIPQIVFHVSWPTSTADGLTLSMSPTIQGSTDTMHVDFINGWQPAAVNADVTACLASSTRCGPVTGPHATPHGPDSHSRTAKASPVS